MGGENINNAKILDGVYRFGRYINKESKEKKKREGRIH